MGNIFNFYGINAAANAAKHIVLKSPLYEMERGFRGEDTTDDTSDKLHCENEESDYEVSL